MDNDVASLAPSNTTTLVEERPYQQPTTITGKPIKHQHDNVTGMMLGDGGGFTGAGTGNLLPPAFTDSSLVRIPLKMSDVNGTEVQVPKKKSFFRKSSSSGDEFKVVMMSRGGYLKYWLKGEDGKFAPTVVEPPEGRQQWFESPLQLNQKWIEEDPTLAKRR